jgi:hypothetical protein
MVGGQPLRDPKAKTDRITHQGLDRAAGVDRDRVLRAHLVGGAIHSLTVDLDVSVGDELSSLCTGAGESEALHDIVQASLELAHQLVTGCLGLTAAGVEVAPQLTGLNTIEPLQLLFLFELRQVVGITLAATTGLARAPLLPRRVGPARLAALAGDLAGALEAELHPGAPGALLNR